MMHAEQTVMFSSDYPHWDNDNPKMILRRVDPVLRGRILGGRAMEVYGLTVRPEREHLPAYRESAPTPAPAGAAGQYE